jgi:hypothetical protein
MKAFKRSKNREKLKKKEEDLKEKNLREESAEPNLD